MPSTIHVNTSWIIGFSITIAFAILYPLVVAFTAHRLRPLFIAGRSCLGISGALVHDPALLRPWIVLSPSIGERLGRPRDRRVHSHAL